MGIPAGTEAGRFVCGTKIHSEIRGRATTSRGRFALMSQHLAPAVVLVRPQEEGNIGATARAMANMGLERLILVQPVAGIGRTARAFAVGAQEVLDGAEVAPSLAEALGPYRFVSSAPPRPAAGSWM